MWMQQDGATAHTAHVSLDVLKRRFGDRILSKKAAFPWPARSPDLNPLDFFMRGFLKARVYQAQPRNLTELKASIRAVLATVTRDMCQRVMTNLQRRLRGCVAAGGQVFEQGM